LEAAAKYQASREQAAGEFPDLIARHHERMGTIDQRAGSDATALSPSRGPNHEDHASRCPDTE